MGIRAELGAVMGTEGQGIGCIPNRTRPDREDVRAHARALGAVLVTHNLREFKRVPDLAIEDWA